MNELIPQRVELFHPMVVHFPIALLLTAALARCVLLFLESREIGVKFRWIYFWSWTLGSLGLIASYLSGEEAEDVVNKIICDPTITHDHADFAFYALWLSLGTLLLSALRLGLAGRLKEKIAKAVLHAPKSFAALTRGVLVGEILTLLATLGTLVWTAHLGGTLVYEQGAGYLRTPNEQCDEGVSLPGDARTIDSPNEDAESE